MALHNTIRHFLLPMSFKLKRDKIRLIKSLRLIHKPLPDTPGDFPLLLFG